MRQPTRRQQRILDDCRLLADSGCWIWIGQISNSGYGRITVMDGDGGLRKCSADTASWEAFVGPVPAGMLVRQTCGNRLCVNPAHLELFRPGQGVDPRGR